MEYVSRVPRPPLDGLLDDLYYLEGAPPYVRLTLPPMPAAELCDRPVTVEQVWGRPAIAELRDRLATADGPHEMLARLEEELTRRLCETAGLGLVSHTQCHRRDQRGGGDRRAEGGSRCQQHRYVEVRRQFLREHPGHVLDSWPLPAD